MYKHILLAIDLNDETSCRKPLLSAVELARTFCARRGHPGGKVGLIAADLENRIAALIRRVNASDLKLNILVTHGVSIYAEILGAAEEAEADLVVVGSHRPAMKDYLLGTNAARVVRHARCSVLVARD